MTTSVMALALQSGITLPVGGDMLIVVILCVLLAVVVLQAILLLVMAAGVSKSVKQMVETIGDLQAKVDPILDSTRTLLDDTGPKVRVITSNVLEASHLLREQMKSIHGTVTEVSTRTRKRIVMLDEMVGAGVMTLDRAVSALQEGILAPMRQLNALLAGVRTGLDVLRKKDRKTHASQDEDLFV